MIIRLCSRRHQYKPIFDCACVGVDSIKTSMRGPLETALLHIGVGNSQLWNFGEVHVKDKIILVEVLIQGNDAHVRASSKVGQRIGTKELRVASGEERRAREGLHSLARARGGVSFHHISSH